MPADPKLNEARLLLTLSNDDIPLTPDGVRALCSLVVLACYDRKVEREFFASVLDLVATINSALGEIICGGRMAQALHDVDPERTPTLLMEQSVVHGRIFRQTRKLLAEKFALVTQCPTTQDKVS